MITLVNRAGQRQDRIRGAVLLLLAAAQLIPYGSLVAENSRKTRSIGFMIGVPSAVFLLGLGLLLVLGASRSRVEVSDRGIRSINYVGGGRLVPWSQITGIEEFHSSLLEVRAPVLRLTNGRRRGLASSIGAFGNPAQPVLEDLLARHRAGESFAAGPDADRTLDLPPVPSPGGRRPVATVLIGLCLVALLAGLLASMYLGR